METKPKVEQLVDLFDAWIDDDSLRQKVFVTNPDSLLGAG
jgi:hypothetical protein